jgi:MoCo/4Fe-4S cofactor protein with predicted Tat translocation signal
MEDTNKRYWKGIEELKNDINVVKNADKEFNFDEIEGGTYRRDFLKVLGFGMAAVSLAACDAPVRHTIPYLNKPVDVEPGVPNYYATSYVQGGDYASILVKTVEGRPIKIQGNSLSGISKGAVSAVAHGSLLGLYDNEKLRAPQKDGKEISWENLDKEVIADLSSASNIRIVSNTILSPTFAKLLGDFASKYPSAKLVQYDPSSSYALVQANERSFGKAVIPSYKFENADVIVGINADFLGTWISPLEYNAGWAANRKVNSGKDGKKTMSRHYQYEPTMTISGANADYRGRYLPSQEGLFVANLYNRVSDKLGKGSPLAVQKVDFEFIDKCARDLVKAGGKSLVVSGSGDVSTLVIVNAINDLLGSVGNTIDFANTVNFRQGNDTEFKQFVADLNSGSVDAVIFVDANPVYDTLVGQEIANGLKKAKLTVAITDRQDETASNCKYVALGSHYLESWGDANPKTGFYSLVQPTISNIFKSRQAESSFLTWAGLTVTYHEYLKANWETNILKGSSWVKALHDGVYETGAVAASGASFIGNVIDAAAEATKAKGNGIELFVFENSTIGSGKNANNPWLQETPDPISKVTWENTAAFSLKFATELGIAQGDWVNVSVGDKVVELPVLIQPGQPDGTVAIAKGYGRTKAGKSGNVGVDVLPLLKGSKGSLSGWADGVKIEKTKSNYTLGQTQTHETYMGRKAVVQETILSEYVKNVKAGRFEPKIATSEGPKRPNTISLWNGHEKKNHNWGMVIDLNTCTGCASCVVSCQAENNIPVVGKAEVARAREMHWIRIDRYYSSDAPRETGYNPANYKAMEVASDNPEVVFQPMMCQHCSNAPCETVCPVLATTHSSEGLNQMAYNRCVGTRYCANNCPYKVRRFNWFKYFENDEFDYNLNNELGRMVINPEVTVRSRGVIEKCSMCVQRIQEGKLIAKKEKRAVKDGDINVACASSCPTNSITFGDMNNPESEISKLLVDEVEGRAFHMLEEINVLPQLSYLVKVRNKDKEDSKVVS